MKIVLSTALSLYAATALAQSPLIKDTKALYEMTKTNITKAAAKMPEQNYSFKPTDAVRSFGQLIGHVADAQYFFCGTAKGERPAPVGAEKMTSKEQLQAALNKAFAYCDAVYDSMTDATMVQTAKFLGAERTKLSILNFNTSHNNEHYGNIVTYMRLKNLVPPSSEGRQ
jgi:uncharacterized damage-inducible protein DinB